MSVWRREGPRGHCPSRQSPARSASTLPRSAPGPLAFNQGCQCICSTQLLLSGPEPAKTLPVYGPASLADVSRGRGYADNVDGRLPAPNTLGSQ